MESAEKKKGSTKEEQAPKEAPSKSKQYNILVYVRLRPALHSEFAKEVVISCNDDVLSTKMVLFLAQKHNDRY
jgi:hypothetical protein